MSCPSCGGALPAGQDRCAACGTAAAPPVEGALAPDPARPRPEPLREIPGLKKRERTWKDEVRDRMRDRKRRRGGELPLFRDTEGADDVGETPLEDAEAAPEALPTLHAPRHEVAAGPRETTLASAPIELGVDEADLPLRPAGAAPPASVAGDLRLASDAEPRPHAAPRPAPDRERERPDEDWSLGNESHERPRPLERPAYSGERAQAALLDLALLGALWAVVVYFAGRAAHVGLAGLRPAWPYLAGYLAFLGLSYAGYFTGTTGQTLGKIATGLRVVDAGGRPPGYLRALVRAALGSVGVLLAGTGLVPMFLDPARRALHDRVLRTRVVKG